MDCESGGTMEVAALGRPFGLGMLYDCRKDSLIPEDQLPGLPPVSSVFLFPVVDPSQLHVLPGFPSVVPLRLPLVHPPFPDSICHVLPLEHTPGSPPSHNTPLTPE